MALTHVRKKMLLFNLIERNVNQMKWYVVIVFIIIIIVVVVVAVVVVLGGGGGVSSHRLSRPCLV